MCFFCCRIGGIGAAGGRTSERLATLGLISTPHAMAQPAAPAPRMRKMSSVIQVPRRSPFEAPCYESADDADVCFLQFVGERQDEKELRELFNVADKQKSGAIGPSQLRIILRGALRLSRVLSRSVYYTSVLHTSLFVSILRG